MCIELKIFAVVIELGPKRVVDLLMKDDGSSIGNDVIVAYCKDGLNKIMRIRIQRCFKEANNYTNILARKGVLLKCFCSLVIEFFHFYSSLIIILLKQ